MKKLALIAACREGTAYCWNGFPFRTDIVSIVAGEELRGTKKLKEAIAKLLPARPTYLRENLFESIRALDTFNGYGSDVQLIQDFGKQHGIRVEVA